MKTEKLKAIAHELFIGASGLTSTIKTDKSSALKVVPVKEVNSNKTYLDPRSGSFMQAKNKKGLEKFLIKEGDVIISTRGTHFKAIVVPALEDQDLYVSNNCTVLRLEDGVLPEYFVILFNSPRNQHFLQRQAKGAAIHSLSRKDLNELPVPLPPLKEQKELIDFVKSSQAFITNCRKQIDLVEELIQARVDAATHNEVKNV